MALIKYGPLSGAMAGFDTFPGLRAFEETMGRLFAEPNGRPWVPAVDVMENENELVVKADIPDVKFEDIDVRLENGTMTIRGERKFEKKEEGKGGYHRIERGYGRFERAFTLPETVNAEAVKADYKNGVLTINLPKKEIAKPRQVKVQIANN